MKIVMMCLEILWFGLKGAMAIAIALMILAMIYLATLTPGFMEEYCAMKWDQIEAEDTIWKQREVEAALLKEKDRQVHLLEMEELEKIQEQWARDTVLPPPGTVVQLSGP